MTHNASETVINIKGETVAVVSQRHWDVTRGAITRWFFYVGAFSLIGGSMLYARLTDQVTQNTTAVAGISRVLDMTRAIQTQLDSMRIEMRHLTPRSER